MIIVAAEAAKNPIGLQRIVGVGTIAGPVVAQPRYRGQIYVYRYPANVTQLALTGLKES